MKLDITQGQVREIYMSDLSIAELANKYKISRYAVNQIKIHRVNFNLEPKNNKPEFKFYDKERIANSKIKCGG